MIYCVEECYEPGTKLKKNQQKALTKAREYTHELEKTQERLILRPLRNCLGSKCSHQCMTNLISHKEQNRINWLS